MSDAIPFIDLKKANEELEGAIEDAVGRVVSSGWYLLGAELEGFEREFADYCATRHCVGVGSGLSALQLTLRAAGGGPGDEGIVPAHTWVATRLGVSRAGAPPGGVDVRAETYNPNPAPIARAITQRTAAGRPGKARRALHGGPGGPCLGRAAGSSRVGGARLASLCDRLRRSRRACQGASEKGHRDVCPLPAVAASRSPVPRPRLAAQQLSGRRDACRPHLEPAALPAVDPRAMRGDGNGAARGRRASLGQAAAIAPWNTD